MKGDEIIKLTYIIITFIIITLLILALIILKIKQIKQQWDYEHKIFDLELKLYCLKTQLLNSHSMVLKKIVSQDEIDAVRYAMKHSHPDNGGNVKDFIKFKKCYEELIRK